MYSSITELSVHIHTSYTTLNSQQNCQDNVDATLIETRQNSEQEIVMVIYQGTQNAIYD